MRTIWVFGTALCVTPALSGCIRNVERGPPPSMGTTAKSPRWHPGGRNGRAGCGFYFLHTATGVCRVVLYGIMYIVVIAALGVSVWPPGASLNHQASRGPSYARPRGASLGLTNIRPCGRASLEMGSQISVSISTVFCRAEMGSETHRRAIYTRYSPLTPLGQN